MSFGSGRTCEVLSQETPLDTCFSEANAFTVMMGLHGVPGKPHGVWELALAVGTHYIP